VRMADNNSDGVVPAALQCGICSQLCKRGVKLACCGAVGCRSCATKTITRDKKCWSCGSEALSKDLLNDESLRLGVEKFQKGEWKEEDGEKQIGNPGLKNEEQEFIRSAEDEIKAKAAKKAASKRELPDCEVKGSAVKKANLTLTEVTLQMMRDRNEEFEAKMNNVERASKELRYGAQLELMYYFDKTEASCKICGDQLNSEKLTLSHLQQKHKVEYNNLKTVLSPPDNNMLTLCLQKALKSEFIFAREQIFPVPVNY